MHTPTIHTSSFFYYVHSLFKSDFIFNYYMCAPLCVCTHGCRNSQRPQESIDSTEAGFTDSFEMFLEASACPFQEQFSLGC